MNKQKRDEYLKIKWTGPGWEPLIKELNDKLSEIDPDYTINQIKEKFGGLRYYISSRSDNADKLYELEYEYEKRSFGICEDCGSTEGVTTEGGWLRTLCKKCMEDYLKDEEI